MLRAYGVLMCAMIVATFAGFHSTYLLYILRDPGF